MVKKILKILSCDAGGVLKLDKGAAMALINGLEVKGGQLHVKVEYYKTDEKGNLIQEVKKDGSIGSVIITIDKNLRSIEIGYIVEE